MTAITAQPEVPPIYKLTAVIKILTSTPRNEWTTSPEVSKVLLSCPRVRQIIQGLMIKRAVKLQFAHDVTSEVASIVQMKMFGLLDEPSQAYSVIYRVSQLVIYNWGKKEENTFFSQEISMNECKMDQENEQELMDRLNLISGFVNDGTEAERSLDKTLARARFSKKLDEIGWPADIERHRKKIGRPSKK